MKTFSEGQLQLLQAWYDLLDDEGNIAEQYQDQISVLAEKTFAALAKAKGEV